ncbi:hypothetical protein J6T21_01405 [Candidatus Saccharibacteria bacterium]|nr:hypothetical protein [Candidatus Saccharibacteria bacterium]
MEIYDRLHVIRKLCKRFVLREKPQIARHSGKIDQIIRNVEDINKNISPKLSTFIAQYDAVEQKIRIVSILGSLQFAAKQLYQLKLISDSERNTINAKVNKDLYKIATEADNVSVKVEAARNIVDQEYLMLLVSNVGNPFSLREAATKRINVAEFLEFLVLDVNELRALRIIAAKRIDDVGILKRLADNVRDLTILAAVLSKLQSVS